MPGIGAIIGAVPPMSNGGEATMIPANARITDEGDVRITDEGDVRVTDE